MKIAIISQYNIFTSVGGTEYYVDMLIKGLLERNHEVVFITMGNQTDNTVIESYKHREFLYKCFFLATPIFSELEIKQLVISSTWEMMQPILTQEKIDIIHVHSLTTFFNIRHFEKCKAICKNMFFTTHIPAHFCPQGDLVKFNKAPCDGILYSRCSYCVFTKSFKQGLSNLFRSQWKRVLEQIDIMNKLEIKLICVSNWQKQQAILNGYEAGKVCVVRQAIITENYNSNQPKRNVSIFTIGYLGRLSEEKGAKLLLELIAVMLQTTNYCFVLGVPIKNCNPRYLITLRKLEESGGERIRVFDDITSNNKATFFDEIDCLLIPSFFIETGPIVLLEALMFNKHIVSPNVGGPIEFKEIFENHITSYEWNLLPSAIQALQEASRKISKGTDNAVLLKMKEKQFTDQHEEIYAEAYLLQEQD